MRPRARMWLRSRSLTTYPRHAEPTITPEIFASHLCADLRLPTNPFYADIVSAVKRQLADAQLSATYEGHLGASFGEVREENRLWFEERSSKRRRIEKADEDEDIDQDEAPMLASELVTHNSVPTDEMRVVIKVREASPPRINVVLTFPSLTARHHARFDSARRQVRMGHQQPVQFAGSVRRGVRSRTGFDWRVSVSAPLPQLIVPD